MRDRRSARRPAADPRSARPPQVPRAGERVRAVRRARSPTSTATSSTSRRRSLHVRLPRRATCCSRRAAPAGCRFRAVPDRYLAFPDFALSPAQWDALQIPVSVAFFFVNSTLERVAAFYPGPAGATESLLPARHVGRRRGREPRARRRSSPTSRRSWCEPAGRRRRRHAECFLVPIDACYELVGHLRRLWRGLRRRRRGPRRARRVLRPACGRARDDRRCTFEVRRRAAEPYAAVPTIMLRLRIEEADGGAVHALALRVPDPDRAAAPPLRHGRGGPARRAVRRAVAVGRLAAPVPVDPREHDGHGLHRRDRDRPAGHVHLRLRGRGHEVPARARRRRASRCCCCSRARASRRARRLRRPSRSRGTRRRRSRCRSGCGASVMDLYFPNAGWIRVDRDTLDALQRFKADRALPTWDQAFEQLLKEAGADAERRDGTRGGSTVSGGDDDRRPDRFAGGAPIADAVLYEGYVLYPYRASSSKNQLRWQFGVLVPAPLSRRRPVGAVVHPHRVPRRPRRRARRCPVRVSCLQVQRRTVERASDDGVSATIGTLASTVRRARRRRHPCRPVGRGGRSTTSTCPRSRCSPQRERDARRPVGAAARRGRRGGPRAADGRARRAHRPATRGGARRGVSVSASLGRGTRAAHEGRA